MRETRLYGSEGGGIELNRFSLPYRGSETSSYTLINLLRSLSQ